MNNLQENHRHILSQRQSRYNRGPAYQNLPESPSHSSRPSASHHRRRRGTQNNRSQASMRRRNRHRHVEQESPVDIELRHSVNSFLDKYYSNQMYTLIIFLAAVLSNVNLLDDLIVPICFVGLAVGYLIHLIIGYTEAQTRMQERRIEYKIFEFGVATALVFFPSRESSNIFFGILAVFLLISYMLKAITAYNCNHSELVKLINQVNRVILLIRMFIFLQGFILLFQSIFKGPFPSYMVFAPILVISFIISAFTMKLLADILMLERSQIWGSDLSEKTMGIIWIFGNLLTLSILLLVAFLGFALGSPSKTTSLRFCLIVVIWCATSLLLTKFIRNGVFMICRALVANGEASPVVEEYEEVNYVFRISNTYFRKATEEEIAKFSEDIEPVEEAERNNEDLEAGLDTKLEEKAKCIVCYRKLARAVYMECGHGGVCFTCAKKINKRHKECHMCRQKIRAILILNVKNNKGNLYEVINEIRNIE